jgi:hypothetical protein
MKLNFGDQHTFMFAAPLFFLVHLDTLGPLYVGRQIRETYTWTVVGMEPQPQRPKMKMDHGGAS